MISSSVRNWWPETKFQNEHLLKTFTCLFIHPSLCQVFQIRNFMFVMFSFLGAPFKASFQLECCLKFHQITALSFNEREQLKECFEEPNSVSVKNINRYIINRNGRVLTGNILYRVCFLFSYKFMHKNKTGDITQLRLYTYKNRTKASYSRVKTLPNDILLN